MLPFTEITIPVISAAAFFFTVFYCFSYWQLPPRSPIPGLWLLAQGACLLWGNNQFLIPLWCSDLPYISRVVRYLMPPQLCWMHSDNDLTYWDGIAFVPCLDVVPLTWKVFSSMLTSPCLFWGYCNAMGFLLQSQMLDHCWDDKTISSVMLWSLLRL